MPTERPLTQNEAILNYLQSGSSITALESVHEFNCMRLAARIAGLKADGHDIGDCWVEKPNGKRFKRYFLKETQQELEL